MILTRKRFYFESDLHGLKNKFISPYYYYDINLTWFFIFDQWIYSIYGMIFNTLYNIPKIEWFQNGLCHFLSFLSSRVVSFWLTLKPLNWVTNLDSMIISSQIFSQHGASHNFKESPDWKTYLTSLEWLLKEMLQATLVTTCKAQIIKSLDLITESADKIIPWSVRTTTFLETWTSYLVSAIRYSDQGMKFWKEITIE